MLEQKTVIDGEILYYFVSGIPEVERGARAAEVCPENDFRVD